MNSQKMTGKSQSGVVLLEALVSILIFSVGILAIVGLQASAVKNATDARFRTEAAFLAGDLMSQIWSDATNASLYEYPGSGAVPLRMQPWVARVAATLPGTVAMPPIVDHTPSASLGDVVEITVRWRMPAEEGASLPAHQHRLRAIINRNPT